MATPSKSESEALLCDMRLIYGLESKLGEGRFSTVWKAQTSSPYEKRILAVKMFKDFKDPHRPSTFIDHRLRIQNEVKILNIVRDGPHILFTGKALFLSDFNKPVQLSMEYYAYDLGYLLKGTMATRGLRNGYLLIPPWYHTVLSQMLEALNYLHSKSLRIIHRDVETGNILYNNVNHFVLADFGHAANLDSAPTEISGSLDFMSPEMYEGEVQTLATDIWSLGIVCLDMICFVPLHQDKEPSVYNIKKRLWCQIMRDMAVQSTKPEIEMMVRLKSTDRPNTWDLLDFVKASPSTQVRRIRANEQMVYQIFKYSIRLMNRPDEDIRERVAEYMKEHGLNETEPPITDSSSKSAEEVGGQSGRTQCTEASVSAAELVRSRPQTTAAPSSASELPLTRPSPRIQGVNDPSSSAARTPERPPPDVRRARLPSSSPPVLEPAKLQGTFSSGTDEELPSNIARFMESMGFTPEAGPSSSAAGPSTSAAGPSTSAAGPSSSAAPVLLSQEGTYIDTGGNVLPPEIVSLMESLGLSRQDEPSSPTGHIMQPKWRAVRSSEQGAVRPYTEAAMKTAEPSTEIKDITESGAARFTPAARKPQETQQTASATSGANLGSAGPEGQEQQGSGRKKKAKKSKAAKAQQAASSQEQQSAPKTEAESARDEQRESVSKGEAGPSRAQGASQSAREEQQESQEGKVTDRETGKGKKQESAPKAQTGAPSAATQERREPPRTGEPGPSQATKASSAGKEAAPGALKKQEASSTAKAPGTASAEPQRPLQAGHVASSGAGRAPKPDGTPRIAQGTQRQSVTKEEASTSETGRSTTSAQRQQESTRREETRSQQAASHSQGAKGPQQEAAEKEETSAWQTVKGKQQKAAEKREANPLQAPKGKQQEVAETGETSARPTGRGKQQEVAETAETSHRQAALGKQPETTLERKDGETSQPIGTTPAARAQQETPQRDIRPQQVAGRERQQAAERGVNRPSPQAGREQRESSLTRGQAGPSGTTTSSQSVTEHRQPARGGESVASPIQATRQTTTGRQQESTGRGEEAKYSQAARPPPSEQQQESARAAEGRHRPTTQAVREEQQQRGPVSQREASSPRSFPLQAASSSSSRSQPTITPPPLVQPGGDRGRVRETPPRPTSAAATGSSSTSTEGVRSRPSSSLATRLRADAPAWDPETRTLRRMERRQAEAAAAQPSGRRTGQATPPRIERERPPRAASRSLSPIEPAEQRTQQPRERERERETRSPQRTTTAAGRPGTEQRTQQPRQRERETRSPQRTTTAAERPGAGAGSGPQRDERLEETLRGAWAENVARLQQQQQQQPPPSRPSEGRLARLSRQRQQQGDDEAGEWQSVSGSRRRRSGAGTSGGGQGPGQGHGR